MAEIPVGTLVEALIKDPIAVRALYKGANNNRSAYGFWDSNNNGSISPGEVLKIFKNLNRSRPPEKLLKFPYSMATTLCAEVGKYFEDYENTTVISERDLIEFSKRHFGIDDPTTLTKESQPIKRNSSQ